MQLFYDFLPVIAFFAAYKVAGIYVATAILIVAVVIQSTVQWIRKRKLNPLQLLSAGLVLVFGGLTLAIHDEVFIMWKPTIVNWLFAAAFLGSQLRAFGGKPMIQRLMSAAENGIDLSERSWRHLNHIWVTYFTLLGVANLIVFRNFDEATWVNFKMFGMLGLTIVFVIIQGIWISSRIREIEASE